MTIMDPGLAAEFRHILWDEDADSTAHLTDPEYAHTEFAPEDGSPVIVTGSRSVAALPPESFFACPYGRYCHITVSIGDSADDAWWEMWGHVHQEHNRGGGGAGTDAMMFSVREQTLTGLPPRD